MDESYLKKIKESKETYFEKIVEGLGIAGVHSPEDYMLALNGCTKEEYEEAMDLEEDEEED